MNRNLSGLGGKSVAFYSNDVPNIKQFFKYCIVQCLIYCRAQIISAKINLDAAGFVL